MSDLRFPTFDDVPPCSELPAKYQLLAFLAINDLSLKWLEGELKLSRKTMYRWFKENPTTNPPGIEHRRILWERYGVSADIRWTFED